MKARILYNERSLSSGIGSKTEYRNTTNYRTYLRPGPLRRTESSSSLDTGQSCLAEFDAHNQRDFSRVPLGTG